jgi:hypothetical protein
MGCTIAPIAGKLAMWRSRPTIVTTECKILKLQIDADARLAAAAGGIAHFLATSAELSDEAAAELQKSILAACIEAFENLEGSNAHLTVLFSWYADDRIEVVLQCEATAAPALGLDRIAGLAGQLGATAALSGVDRVQYEARDGAAVTRLIKYLRHAPRIA